MHAGAGMKTRSIFSIVFLIILVAAVSVPALAQPASAALAAPEAPLSGGTFFVDSSADNTTPDGRLTLREAIMLANGGTGPLGLNRPVTWEEFINHMQGSCQFVGSGDTGELSDCGAGYPDTIVFSDVLGSHPVLTPQYALPGFVDSQPTTLDGTYGNVYPIIDAHLYPADNDGLSFGEPSDTAKGITVMNSPRWNFNVYGVNTQLIGVASWRAGQAGMSLRANGIVVDQSLIGVAATNSSDCGSGSTDMGNNQDGILIDTSAKYVVIKNSVIGCNGKSGTYAGVTISGFGTSNNTIGPNNAIGTSTSGSANLANVNSDGVRITNHANMNLVINNIISFNDGNGVALSDVNNATVAGNTLRRNQLDGIWLTGVSQYNVLGGPSFLSAVGGNVIGANHRHGVEIFGADAQNTTLIGNKIGVNAAATAADGNTLSGVMIDGAKDNYIGDASVAQNIIGGNLQHGVALLDGASGNSIAHNAIGANPANFQTPVLRNLFDGVFMDVGAHDNVLGGLTSGASNDVYFSGLLGVVIQGSTTANNKVLGNVIYGSEYDGVAIRSGAHNNTIGTSDSTAPNDIARNGGQGVLLSGGANENAILANDVVDNGKNGIELDGIGTTGNIISGTHVATSIWDGINERNGAGGNRWTHINVAANGGLPIDKNAADDYQNLPDDPRPTIKSQLSSGSTYTLTGSALPSSVFTAVNVEVYYGNHGGLGYLGTAPVDNTGVWTLTYKGALLGGGSLSAFETAYSFLGGASSYEFGGQELHRIFMPLIQR